MPSIAPISDVLARHGARPTPRYTSYPTAPHFAPGFDDEQARSWLSDLDPAEPISLYLHVPYCHEMCWYCGCNMRLARDQEQVSRYVESLIEEIGLLADAVPGRLPVAHLHWGGGTPTSMTPADLQDVMCLVRERFVLQDDAELAIECDPRTLAHDMIEMIGRQGFTRASFGVQEFDAEVQAAINRIQPPELVAGQVGALRAAGVQAINFDLIYGLPLQTTAKLLDTIALCHAMKPNRFSLFGYAHVPWKAARQKLIASENLPSLEERAEQAAAASACLDELGYEAIGLDHFARSDDSLAVAARTGRLHRNFQGYTTDDADTLLAVGTSAIGRTPSGYYQNSPGVRDWRAAIDEGALPVSRSYAFREDDALRGEVIERIMCDGRVDLDSIGDRYGAATGWAADSLASLDPLVRDGVVHVDGAALRLAPWAHPLARVVASAFDRYLDSSPGRHSVSV